MKIQWKLHTAYLPQSSGKVEHETRTLKQTLAKLCQGNSLPWVGMLTMALLKVRCPPWAEIGFSPLEILYGWPPHLVNLRGDTRELGNLNLHTISEIHTRTVDRIPISLGITAHPHQPGDQARAKDWKKEPLKPMWKEPYSVIVTTRTALRVAGIDAWIH